jgi:hypothetical protein
MSSNLRLGVICYYEFFHLPSVGNYVIGNNRQSGNTLVVACFGRIQSDNGRHLLPTRKELDVMRRCTATDRLSYGNCSLLENIAGACKVNGNGIGYGCCQQAFDAAGI